MDRGNTRLANGRADCVHLETNDISRSGACKYDKAVSGDHKVR